MDSGRHFTPPLGGLYQFGRQPRVPACRVEPEPLPPLTWREVQDQWDKGVLPAGAAHDYLGDLLSLVALRAPELLDEANQVYGQTGASGNLPATEAADL
jgi:hypothetical protein